MSPNKDLLNYSMEISDRVSDCSKMPNDYCNQLLYSTFLSLCFHAFRKAWKVCRTFEWISCPSSHAVAINISIRLPFKKSVHQVFWLPKLPGPWTTMKMSESNNRSAVKTVMALKGDHVHGNECYCGYCVLVLSAHKLLDHIVLSQFCFVVRFRQTTWWQSRLGLPYV